MKIILLLVFISVVYGNSARLRYTVCERNTYPPKRAPTKLYTIDLNEQPELRWKNIMIQKGHVLRAMTVKVKKFITEIARNSSIPVELLEYLLPKLGDRISSPIKEEMMGIAKYGYMPFGEVVLFNLFYDLNPLCTSIIARDPHGRLYQARNLDYGAFHYGDIHIDMTQELRDGVINIRYMKNGTTSFYTAGYVGYAGMVTGMKPNVFTFSFNARHPPHGNVNRYLKLVEYILGLGEVNWVTPMLRQMAESSQTYHQALNTLQSHVTVAPVYFIIGGKEPNEGCILTKGTGVDDLLCLNEQRWYLLQTNYDHWLPVPWWDPRRVAGRRCMDLTGQQNIGWPTLYNVLSTKPVLNKDTTYTTLMQIDGNFSTFVRYPDDTISFNNVIL